LSGQAHLRGDGRAALLKAHPREIHPGGAIEKRKDKIFTTKHERPGKTLMNVGPTPQWPAPGSGLDAADWE